LTYSWDFDISDGIGIDAISLNVEWIYPAPGNYTVILTVSDSGSPELMNSTSIVIQVLAPKEQPHESEEEDNGAVDDTSDKDGGGSAFGFWITLGVIILVIIIVGIVMLVIWKKRQRISQEKLDLAKVEGVIHLLGYPSAPASAPIIIPADQSYMARGAKTSLKQQMHVCQPPLCPKCGQTSQYYSEYNCYWCVACQNYVYQPGL
jgi:hypothetical protein